MQYFRAAVALAFAMALSSAPAAPPAHEPGGTGQLTLEGLGSTCFKTASRQVPVVCGKPVVHYKLSALMGDPLGSYGLTWALGSVHLANADGKGSEEYGAARLPSPIAEAAARSELWVYAAALVRGSVPVTALQFNTGLGVKPGDQVSFNVPDGYGWDKFLVVPQTGVGPGWACSDKGMRWVEPKDAKNLMRNGIDLYGLQICPRTSVDVEALERAIDAYCGAHPASGSKYCPKPEKEEARSTGKLAADPFASLSSPAGKPSTKANAGKTAPGNDPFAALDSKQSGEAPTRDMGRAFEQAESARAASVEQERRYNVAYAACQKDLAQQQSCAQNSCGSAPAHQVCTRSEEIEPPPCKGPPGTGCLVIPQYRCAATGPNPAFPKWEACVRDAASQCATQGKKITSVSACVSERLKP